MTPATPLPWRYSTGIDDGGCYAPREWHGVTADSDDVFTGDGLANKEDCAFIVHAVNLHEKLVEFVRDSACWMDTIGIKNRECKCRRCSLLAEIGETK